MNYLERIAFSAILYYNREELIDNNLFTEQKQEGKIMKHKLKKGDLVSWQVGNRIYYGRVMFSLESTALIQPGLNGSSFQLQTIPIKELKYEPPVTINAEDLEKFARFEISFSQLMQNRPFADFQIKNRYPLVLNDFKTAIENFKKSGMSEKDFLSEYVKPIKDRLLDALCITESCGDDLDEKDKDQPCPNEMSVFGDVWLGLAFHDEVDFILFQENLDQIILEIQTWEENKGKPYLEREYTNRQAHSFLHYWNDDRLMQADEKTKAAYRKILDQLCETDDVDALRTKAYACYGNGNAAYGQNWQESLKCLLRIMEIKPNPETANTLGYMYYYGRCTDGVPEYEKAFYYFSIGAAGWYYESLYKLSDMFYHGYGVPKNTELAASIITELYFKQIDYLCDGHFQCNFADVALRMGNIHKEGFRGQPNPDIAYYYYLQAQYAIRMRMADGENYGDSGVAAGIDAAIEEILPETRYLEKKNTMHYCNLAFLLQNGLQNRHFMEMKIHKSSETEAKLTFRIVPFEKEEHPPKLLVTMPSLHFCGLLEKVTVKLKNIYCLDTFEDAQVVLFDDIAGNTFELHGKWVAEIQGDVVFHVPATKQKKYRFASVLFSPNGKKYDYLCDLPLKIGDMAIVETKNGEQTVKIVSIFERSESESALPFNQYKKILRKA